MGFMDDLKTDQRTQMLVAGIVFFSLAFPLYFNYAAGNVDEFEASGPIGNYSVEGTYSFHEIASGSQYIDDGSTIEITANSDAAGDEIKGKNLVGVRATLTYTDDESGGGFGCIKDLKIEKYIVNQSDNDSPSICFIPTATGDDQGYIDNFYKAFDSLNCKTSHIDFFKRTIKLDKHISNNSNFITQNYY